ncbi:MAG: hypothetical protein R2874_13340 [Desulfobacterales bacterium]
MGVSETCNLIPPMTAPALKNRISKFPDDGKVICFRLVNGNGRELDTVEGVGLDHGIMGHVAKYQFFAGGKGPVK